MGTTEVEMGLHTDVWVCLGVGIPNWGYTWVFDYAQAYETPLGATYRCLKLQPGLQTGDWIPNRGYTQVLGSSTGATHGLLEFEMGACASCWSQMLGCFAVNDMDIMAAVWQSIM